LPGRKTAPERKNMPRAVVETAVDGVILIAATTKY
jgi:hypothetical protein